MLLCLLQFLHGSNHSPLTHWPTAPIMAKIMHHLLIYQLLFYFLLAYQLLTLHLVMQDSCLFYHVS
jgi:hypothetical protein